LDATFKSNINNIVVKVVRAAARGAYNVHEPALLESYGRSIACIQADVVRDFGIAYRDTDSTIKPGDYLPVMLLIQR
jgi:hypothetical protein